MKKNFLFLSMALFVLLLAACSQEEIVSGSNKTEGPVTVSVNIPVNNPVTRVAPDIPEGYVLRCIMQLVDQSGNNIENGRYVQEVPSGSENVTFAFETPDNYQGAMFWADYVKKEGGGDIAETADYFYTTTNLKAVGYNGAKTGELFNNDAADAFAGYMLGSSNSFSLERPFTKVTFKADAAYAQYTKITVTNLPAPTAYNIMTGATSAVASGIQSTELAISDNIWFSAYLFVSSTGEGNLGESNDIAFTLADEQGESAKLTMPGENIILTKNYNVTATVSPSKDNQQEVTVTFPGDMVDPNALQIGDYINTDGSYTKTYTEGQSVAVVFALAGSKTDNSDYGGKAVAGYAMALKGLSGIPYTAETVDVSTITPVTVNEALYTDGYGIEAWNEVREIMDGDLIKSKFNEWITANQINENNKVSEWYVPTPAMMVDIIGMMYNEAGWSIGKKAANLPDVAFPDKNQTFADAYANGGGDEYLAMQATAKNLLTSALSTEGKIPSIQVDASTKNIAIIVPAKANNSIVVRPVLTVFSAE